MIDGVPYCNDGDWVESCSALVEHMDGRLEIVQWHRSQDSDEPATTEAQPEVDLLASTADAFGQRVPA